MNGRLVTFGGLSALVVSLGFAAAEGAPPSQFTPLGPQGLAIAVGACETGQTSFKNNNCMAKGQSCQETTTKVTLTIGGEGKIGIGIKGDVSFEFDIPTGCVADTEKVERCANQLGVFLKPIAGPVLTLTANQCATVHMFQCKKTALATITIPIPASMQKLFGGATAKDVAIPGMYHCVPDDATSEDLICPGGNGNNTTYDTVKTTCDG